jgi:ubiquinone/menaquinone biosynthesis C-methylase UbiE
VRTAILESNRHDEFASSQPANFNRLARVYRWLEWFTFGPMLWKCRCAYLAEMMNERAALVIGDGDGRFTAQLLKQNPQIAVDAVDASDAMLRRLMRRAGRNASRVRVHLGDARQLQFAAGKFDLVATHFFLDCLTTVEVESLAMRLREALTSDASWVISEFTIPDNWYGRLIAGPIVAALYFAFRYLTGLTVRELPAHREALQRAGFALMSQRKRLWGLLVSELWKRGPASNTYPYSIEPQINAEL